MVVIVCQLEWETTSEEWTILSAKVPHCHAQKSAYEMKSVQLFSGWVIIKIIFISALVNQKERDPHREYYKFSGTNNWLQNSVRSCFNRATFGLLLHYIWAAIGLSLSRWLIEADAGRRINLTLYDFTSMTSSTGARDVISGSSTSFCRRLAVVRDMTTGREANICSGARRTRHAYLSDSHRVEITMATASVTTATMDATDSNPSRFLIRYEG